MSSASKLFSQSARSKGMKMGAGGPTSSVPGRHFRKQEAFNYIDPGHGMQGRQHFKYGAFTSFTRKVATEALGGSKNLTPEIRSGLKAAQETTVASYHLILNEDDIDFEVKSYQDNFINYAGTQAEIWKMHNWSGVYDPNYDREGEKKTCGRPFSPDLVIRAGGIEGKTGAVHPCCQVLGQDDEAVLGHLSDQSIEEVWNGPEYTKLREQHSSGDYPDYCKGCDFLIDDPEVLVWSNSNRSTYKMVGTDFSLKEFQHPR